jgi:hypothetical protein
MGAGIAQVAAQAGHRGAAVRHARGRRRRGQDQARPDPGRPGGQGQAGRRRRTGQRWRASSRSAQLDDAAARASWSRPSSSSSRPSARCSAARGHASAPTRAGHQHLVDLGHADRQRPAAPGRLVGMHFFNPVPLMKLVEVVSGLQTDARRGRGHLRALMAWGKTPVHAKSTPGFIVNRIARPYYAETLALLLEQAAAAAGARRLPARRRLPHGALRADGPDRPRHQLRRHALGLRGQLLRQALPALAGAARDGRRRPARPQERPRLLRLPEGVPALPPPATPPAAGPAWRSAKPSCA